MVCTFLAFYSKRANKSIVNKLAYDLNREIADVFCPPEAISAEIIILMLVKFVSQSFTTHVRQ